MEKDNPIFTAYTSFIKSNVKFALTPLEAVPSLPVPTIIKGKPYLALFFFIGKRLNKNEKMKLYRPIVKFIVDVNSSRIANYMNYSLIDEFPDYGWQEPIGEFPHDEISEMTLKEYKQRKNNLIQSYDKVIKELMTNGNNQLIKNEFKKEFYQLCEPGLLPFMKKIGKDFFEWLN